MFSLDKKKKDLRNKLVWRGLLCHHCRRSLSKRKKKRSDARTEKCPDILNAWQVFSSMPCSAPGYLLIILLDHWEYHMMYFDYIYPICFLFQIHHTFPIQPTPCPFLIFVCLLDFFNAHIVCVAENHCLSKF